MICLDINVVIAAINRRNAAVARRIGEALTQGASIGLRSRSVRASLRLSARR
jgi:tRNA(fMet)-specific endonuclease VapC